MATTDNPDDKKQIMDVTKPGKSTPDSTSRPVIVGHKPMMKDPMVSSSDDDSKNDDKKPDDSTPTTKREAHKVLKPISDGKDQGTDEQPKPDTEPAGENPETPKPEDSSTTEDTINNTTPDTDITDSAVVDAVAGQADRKKQEAIDNDEALKHKEAIDKLVEQKKYFLPINQVKRRRNTRWSVAVLVLLIVGSLGFLLAVDAGVVKPGFSVPFDFIKDDEATKTDNVATVPAETVQKPDTEAVATERKLENGLLQSHQKGFTIKIPDGWRVNSLIGDDYVSARSLESVTYTEGVAPTVTETTSSGGEGPMRFTVIQFTDEDVHGYPVSPDSQQVFIGDYHEGVRYYSSFPAVAESEDVGDINGVDMYTYEFKTEGKSTYVVYEIVTKENDPNQLEIVEAAVRTLQIM